MRERVWRADPGPPVVRVGLQAAEQGRRPADGVGDQRLKGLPEGADGAAGEALPPSLFGGGDFMADVLGAGPRGIKAGHLAAVGGRVGLLHRQARPDSPARPAVTRLFCHVADGRAAAARPARMAVWAA